jgi:hypothetical protein
LAIFGYVTPSILSIEHVKETCVAVDSVAIFYDNVVAGSSLLLGVSLHTIMNGTHSDPCQSGSRIPNTFIYAKDMLIVFCRQPKLHVASMRRLRWIGGRKAYVTEWAEARMQRWHADHWSEVPGPM